MPPPVILRAALGAAAWLATASGLVAAEPLRDLALFLLIGQSNMAGRGPVADADRAPVSGIWMLDASGAWVPAHDPVHFDRPERVGVGPALSFAAAVRLARPGQEIGLIPCAVGGTRLDQWTPAGELYRDALARARVALAAGALRGILWHQGESDCGDEGLARSYAMRWQVMIQALRRDLDAPAVPVLVGGLGDFLDRPFAATVNAQLASLADPAAHVGFVPATGLESLADHLHFSTPAQREFGRRYAQAYLGLAP